MQRRKNDMPQRCIMIVLDGLGDRAHAALQGRTPLQAAHTPTFDQLAAQGCNGLYHAGLVGQAMPSELAHTALFGYPADIFPGRGALEALGMDLPFSSGDVALMARFVCAARESSGLRLLYDTPPELTDGDARELASVLPSPEILGLKMRFHLCKNCYGVLLLQGDGCPHITDTNPIRNNTMLIAPRPYAETQGAERKNAERTAAALTTYLARAHAALAVHPVNLRRARQGLPPANVLATQRAGSLRTLQPFFPRYGLRGASIASGTMYKGLARYLGLDFLQVRDGDAPGKDLEQRLSLAEKALETHEFIHVHTKAPDQAAHAKDPLLKRDVIAALDKGASGILPRLAKNPDLLVALTADHSTPSSGTLIHSGETVPLVLHGEGMRRDAVTRFDEVAAAGGALGTLRGEECMLLILSMLDKARLLGLRDNPAHLPGWPGTYEPLRFDAPEALKDIFDQ